MMIETILIALGMTLYLLLAIPVSVGIARYMSEKDDSKQILNRKRY